MVVIHLQRDIINMKFLYRGGILKIYLYIFFLIEARYRLKLKTRLCIWEGKRWKEEVPGEGGPLEGIRVI